MKLNKTTCFFHALRLFLEIVYRKWYEDREHTVRISPSTAWDVAKGIWLK